MSAPKLFRAEYFFWMAPIMIAFWALHSLGHPHLRVAHQHRNTAGATQQVQLFCQDVGLDLRDKLKWHWYTPADGRCPLIRLVKPDNHQEVARY